MKKLFILFLNKPIIVVIVFSTIAIVVGFFGSKNIHQARLSQFAKSDLTITKLSSGVTPDNKNLSLGFLSGGRVKTVSVKVGDKVKKGEVLATLETGNTAGVLTQAKAAYDVAQANYQKIINGATSATIDVAKANVNTAEVNLDEITKQQEILVDNAYRTLLNSTFQAEIGRIFDLNDSLIVSGNYKCDKEGSYNIITYGSSGGTAINYTGIEKGSLVLSDIPRPLGICGLSLSYDKTKVLNLGIDFNIEIPNKSAANYNLNNNAYQLALQTKKQVITGAQAVLDQANASLELVVTNARPEDITAAQAQIDNASGALQIANAAYNNTIILAPGDGVINAVYITEGQIVAPSTSVIEFVGLSN